MSDLLFEIVKNDPAAGPAIGLAIVMVIAAILSEINKHNA